MLTPTFSISSSTACNTTFTQTTAGMTVCPGNANYVYTPWIQGAVDLTPFIGSYVTFELTVSDCSSAGHPSYCYFDATCAPMNFLLNGNPTQLDSTNNICAANLPMTLVAPNGFQSYAWAGPNTSSTPTLNATSYGSYTLTLTGLATCCPIKKIFNISPCTGITEKATKSNDIFIYPNPAKDHIRIENINDKIDFEIFDILGKQITKREPLPENKTVTLTDHPKGIYFMKLYDGKSQIKTFKIIKE
ncbi:MAG: T9SS type A sorting domain-containing protein [Sphingobacteriaceae bacterium]